MYKPAIKLVASLLLTAAACSNSPEPTSSATGACELAFFPSDYDKRCQVASDDACCSQQKDCAKDADCVQLVECINACPTPRQDDCVSACGSDGGTDGPGYKHLDAIASCSKGPTYKEPKGVSCAWPSGDGD